MLLQLHTFSFESLWLKRQEVSVAIFPSIITYNNTHSVRDNRCNLDGQSSATPSWGSGPVKTKGSLNGICGRLSSNGTGFFPLLLFSPVSIILPVFYTQSFIYHQNCATLTTASLNGTRQSQTSDRNLMSTSTNIVSRFNEQLYADQTSSWNVQYHNTTQLQADRNITAQCNELISVIQLELFP